MPETGSTPTKYLRNLWDEAEAAGLSANPLEVLRYRSNLLGADLRITNFGGGPILPQDCANAICWLAGDASAKTTGHVIPVDGGLPDAFLR